MADNRNRINIKKEDNMEATMVRRGYGPQQAGAITYTNVTCPICGAVLQLGTQALSPVYTEAAVCPFCEYNFGTQVVSLNVVSGPTTGPIYVPTASSGFDMNSMMNMIMMIIMMSTMMSLVVPQKYEKYLPSTYTERAAGAVQKALSGGYRD
jgi:hypothetical protein